MLSLSFQQTQISPVPITVLDQRDDAQGFHYRDPGVIRICIKGVHMHGNDLQVITHFIGPVFIDNIVKAPDIIGFYPIIIMHILFFHLELVMVFQSGNSSISPINKCYFFPIGLTVPEI